MALQIKSMGPCEVVWGYGEAGAMNLGPFLGATLFKGETHVQDILEERYGDAPVDAIMIGTIASLELRMTRSTLEQLAEVLNAFTSGDVLYLENQLGCEMYGISKSVVIKPICDNEVSTDPVEWVQIYKCYPIPGWELTWDKATQRVFPIMFKVFPSQESGFEGKFGTIGMESGSTEYGL
uniref:Uncharacterized protein n=1 Tax=viral metagenome TaxID=1070528 RepID=A0A6M3M1A2_9ZZZZ